MFRLSSIFSCKSRVLEFLALYLVSKLQNVIEDSQVFGFLDGIPHRYCSVHLYYALQSGTGSYTECILFSQYLLVIDYNSRMPAKYILIFRIHLICGTGKFSVMFISD